MSIRHRFERREALGTDNKQRLGRVEISDTLHKVTAINVCDKTKLHGPIAVCLQRFVCHHGAQSTAANANIDNVAKALPGVAFPLAITDTVGKLSHFVEYSVHPWYHILPVNEHGCASWHAQRHVQSRLVFGNVYLLTAEHTVNSRLQSGFSGQLYEKLDGLVSNSILGVIQVYPCAFGRHTLPPQWVISEEPTEMHLANFSVVACQSPPCRSLPPEMLADWYVRCHARSSFASRGCLTRIGRSFCTA